MYVWQLFVGSCVLSAVCYIRCRGSAVRIGGGMYALTASHRLAVHMLKRVRRCTVCCVAIAHMLASPCRHNACGVYVCHYVMQGSACKGHA